MLFERIESPGLAHYSYLIGDKGEALVIDPRRDCEIYLEKAVKNGFDIKNILETHRNEDYVIGSLELAKKTNAQIWHADTQLKYGYGNDVEDGQKWKVGGFTIEAMLTPGHTPGHMSYLLYDKSREPWMIFTGDALFAGDVGRVDLADPEKKEEMARKLYDSLYEKILPLGDEVIVCPSHGPGSVCGNVIEDRPWTTIGTEKKLNPNLQHENKEEFVKNVAKVLERPPYFREMERLNLDGPPVLGHIPAPQPLSPDEFESKTNKAEILDTRSELSFNSAHVPEALSIWQDGLPKFAGWFLPYETPILLVNETDNPTDTMRHLIRLGYDNVQGFLSGNMLSWHKSGRASERIDTVTVDETCTLLDKGENILVLDVRNEKEVEKNRIQGAKNIHLTQLPERLNEIPDDKNIYIFCGSGLRSTTAASILRREGFKGIHVVLGGTAGWNSRTCPIE
ncbi:MAG: MBL fold metallo-hydrolase [Candidatus Hadarchaeota archaeon]